MVHVPIDPIIRASQTRVQRAGRDWVLDKFGAPLRFIARYFLQRRHKRLLASLSEAQLRDAGIDPSHAGRRRAAAVKMPPQSMGLQ